MTALRVVIVDDVATLRRLTGLLLAHAGHEVVAEAADGLAGVAVTLAYSPDLVIMDWQMPELDGIQATRRIRARSPDVYVIAFSSAADPAIRDAFLAAGASACHDKHDICGLQHSITQIAERSPRPPAASTALEVTVRAWPTFARTHIALRGALTDMTLHRLTQALNDLTDTPGRITLDLSDVDAIDPAGLKAVIEYGHTAAARGIEMNLQDPSPTVRRVLARRSDHAEPAATARRTRSPCEGR